MKRALAFIILASCGGGGGGGGGAATTTPTPRNDGSTTPPAAPVRLSVADVKDNGPYVDAARGVIVIEYSSGGATDDAKEIMHAERVCGERLVEGELRAGIMSRSSEPYELACAPDGDRTICRSDALGEYDVDVEWIFAPGASGPMLEAVIAVERATMAQQWIDAADKFVAENLAKLRKEPCP